MCLNGQQILGRPFKLTFYKVLLDGLTPNNCLDEGSIPIYFEGKGIFESDYQKVKIKRGEYERIVEPKWDSVQKKMFFYMPPFEWLNTSSQKNQDLPSEDFMIKCIEKKVSVFEGIREKDQPRESVVKEEQGDQEKTHKQIIEDKQFDIYLSLSAGDWIFSGKVSYFQPSVDAFFPVELDEASVPEFVGHLTQVNNWRFFPDYFGEDFTPIDLKSKSLIKFEVKESEASQNTKPENSAKASNIKTSQKNKSQAKETKKEFEALTVQIHSEIVSPKDYLLLLSKRGFICPQNKKGLGIKFKYQKYISDGEVHWCNAHMLLARVPEMPYSKPKPVVTEETEETQEMTKAEEKKKKKKVKKEAEYVPYDVCDVGVQLSFNGIQFGKMSGCTVKFMMIDSQVGEEEREAFRKPGKKVKKKGGK